MSIYDYIPNLNIMFMTINNNDAFQHIFRINENKIMIRLIFYYYFEPSENC